MVFQVPLSTCGRQIDWCRQGTTPVIPTSSTGQPWNRTFSRGGHTHLREYNNEIETIIKMQVVIESLPFSDLVPGALTSPGGGCAPFLSQRSPPRARAQDLVLSPHFSKPSQSIVGPSGVRVPESGCHTGALYPEACGDHLSTDRPCSVVYGTPLLGQRGTVSTRSERFQGPSVLSRERSEQRVSGLSAKEGKRGTCASAFPRPRRVALCHACGSPVCPGASA